MVSVLDLNTLSFIEGIPVGDNPLAVTIDPGGTFAYVANYYDGTVSTIDIDPESPDYNKVVDVLSVGVGPTDVAVTPDGDRILVANSASGELSVLDADPLSDTYRSVVATVRTTSGARTVAVTPDGAEFYVGVDAGYIIISAESYGVTSSVAASGGSRTVAITPDGALLIVLTTDGTVNIYDIAEGSATENQVVATVRQGSGTLSIAVSPDGAFLFMIQELDDAIHVGIISLSGGYGVVEDGTDIPSGVQLTVVDTLTAGEDPACVAFDPSGSGKFIVANAGDNTVTVFEEDVSGVPRVTTVECFDLVRNFPNPFTQTTTIQFAVPEAVNVRLLVYDVRGRLVRTLVNEHREPDFYTAVWDGRDNRGRRVASGLYFCRFEAGGFKRTQKMMMLR
jgi:DNA-binding beta-propeller fold protein YncE